LLNASSNAPLPCFTSLFRTTAQPGTTETARNFAAFVRQTGERCVGSFIDKICHPSANLWALLPCSDLASTPFLPEFWPDCAVSCAGHVGEGSRDVTSATANVEKVQE
jgi:hypothetical protein